MDLQTQKLIFSCIAIFTITYIVDFNQIGAYWVSNERNNVHRKVLKNALVKFARLDGQESIASENKYISPLSVEDEDDTLVTRSFKNSNSTDSTEPYQDQPEFPHPHETEPIKFERDLLIMVLSKRDNFITRQTIRETWAKNEKNIYFMVGKKYCPYPTDWLISSYGCTLMDYWSIKIEHKDLTKEEQLLLDYVSVKEDQITARLENEENVVLLDIMDFYDGLTHKVKYSMKWAYEMINLNLVDQEEGETAKIPKWIMKIDDDCILKATSYESMLKTKYKNEKYLYFGRIQFHGKPVLKKGKWADHKYPKKFYPWYADGNNGYVISLPILNYLMEEDTFQNLEEYQNEDASLGIWLSQAPFQEEISYKTSKYYIKNLNPALKLCVEGEREESKLKYYRHILVAGHKLNAKEIAYCWDKMFHYVH